jgi:transposase-like protein/IS1 family transposase
MLCPICQQETRKFGKNRSGSQRYRCDECRKTFTDEETLIEDRRCVDREKMILAIRMLLEGNSIRAVQRLLGIHRDTIMNAMVEAGTKCQRFLERTVVNVECSDVQCDEIWGFVNMKDKTRVRKNFEPDGLGDAWCFTAIERHTKLILTFHLGKRTPTDTAIFADNLYFATRGKFQLTTDGYTPYRTAIPAILGGRGIAFATLVKVYGTADEEGSRRYSPAEVIGTIETPVMGEPDEDRICTSHVERSNLTLRMQIRRLTRLTNAFSKKWENHEAALALFFAYYNFCRVHMTLRMTPAQASGLTSETWSVQKLLDEAK